MFWVGLARVWDNPSWFRAGGRELERAGHEATPLPCPCCPLWLSPQLVAVAWHFPGCPACPACAGSDPHTGSSERDRWAQGWPRLGLFSWILSLVAGMGRAAARSRLM